MEENYVVLKAYVADVVIGFTEDTEGSCLTNPGVAVLYGNIIGNCAFGTAEGLYNEAVVTCSCEAAFNSNVS